MTNKHNSNRMCCVPQCTNRAVHNEISQHSFLQDPLRKKEWIVSFHIGKPVTPPMRMCSAHFTPGDFFWSNMGKRKSLSLLGAKLLLWDVHTERSGGRRSAETCSATAGSSETALSAPIAPGAIFAVAAAGFPAADQWAPSDAVWLYRSRHQAAPVGTPE
ncbi:hypothetical protein HPB50_023661 [Hyalomma asiaticum]|uniref:Uncharacterized protein n=1 Tax=Hyalomma asiaticum TaxID=266040 RepID=A0ACB7T4G1_HYAAI|nr:hypothetical protein HPB50_023661 [Hyalomma asiaticum]